MKTLSRKKTLSLELLEDRQMLSVSAVADFENLAVYGPQTPYWYGDSVKVNEPNSFTSGPCEFSNFYSYDDFYNYYSWAGFGYSQVADATTPGFANQMSAFPGKGANNSSTYGIGYYDTYSGQGVTVSISETYQQDFEFSTLQISNTTYAALSIRDGDAFTDSFHNGDYFVLTITGYDENGAAVGNINETLADYRGGKSFILDTWKEVDISSLSGAVSLEFSMTSSDTGSFGMNTPSYFAVDDIVLQKKTDTPNPEPQPGDVLVVSTLDDINDGVYTAGNLSLREAIALAQQWDATDTITFDSKIAGKTIKLSGGEFFITTGMTIDGNGVTIDAQQQSRIFNIQKTDVGLSNMTLTGGKASMDGGAIYFANGSLMVTNVTFVNNTATNYYGGAIYQKSGTSTFSGTTFTSNSANYGGAIYLANGESSFYGNSQLASNTATWGGAIYQAKGTLETEDTLFSSNTATYGGAFYLGKGEFIACVGTQFHANKATYGGGVYQTGGTANLVDAVFANNIAYQKKGSAVAKVSGGIAKVKMNGQVVDLALTNYLDDNMLG